MIYVKDNQSSCWNWRKKDSKWYKFSYKLVGPIDPIVEKKNKKKSFFNKLSNLLTKKNEKNK